MHKQIRINSCINDHVIDTDKGSKANSGKVLSGAAEIWTHSFPLDEEFSEKPEPRSLCK